MKSKEKKNTSVIITVITNGCAQGLLLMICKSQLVVKTARWRECERLEGRNAVSLQHTSIKSPERNPPDRKSI